MGWITLTYRGQTLATYSLAGAVVTIGRAASNDIVIDDLAVSGCHARIRLLPDCTLIEDCASTNGLYVNGDRIHARALVAGDIVGIGGARLYYASDRHRVPAPERTAAARPRAHRPGCAPESGQAGMDAAPIAAQSRDPSGYLVVLDAGPNPRRLELAGKFTTLGHGRRDLAAVIRRDGQYFVAPFGIDAAPRPCVNGEAVGPRPRPLAPDDVVEIAGIRMAFRLAEAAQDHCA